jgi:hypothetical protein
MNELAQEFAGWPLAASMAVALTARALRDGRRRSAINEALHELRRPLQAIALAVGGPAGSGGGVESSMWLATAALERLDREVNGGPADSARETVRCETVLRSAVGRWRARVALGEGSLELRWWAGEATVSGDRAALEQAVDNPFAHLFRAHPRQRKGPGCNRVQSLCPWSGGGRLTIAAAGAVKACSARRLGKAFLPRTHSRQPARPG